MTRQQATPRHTNRLISETSPYLLQHAHNPVDCDQYYRGSSVFLSADPEAPSVDDVEVPFCGSSGFWCWAIT